MATELKLELTAERERLKGHEALIASDEARGQALRNVAALAKRAQGRLDSLSDEEREEVVQILQISVVTTSPVIDGVPETTAISGVVDPQLWADTKAKSPAGAPAPSHSAGRVARKPREGSVAPTGIDPVTFRFSD